MSNYLCFGQIIQLHGEQGLIVSKGFTQSNVYFMTYQNNYSVTNFRESLFQVLPKGSFEIHDEFMKHYKKTTKESQSQRLAAELNQYDSFAKSKFNEEVLFGQDVVLKHVDSEYYLIGSQKCSEYSTEAFQIKLSQHVSSHALFSIQPYQSYQNEGQKIYFDEPLLLINAKQQFYLDFIPRPLQQFEDQEKIEFIKKLQGVQKYALIITHNSRSNWKMKLYLNNSQIQEKKLIRNHDLIYLQYSDDGSFLSGENQIISLHNPNQNTIPLHSVWELQQVGADQGPKFKINSREVPRQSIFHQQSPGAQIGFDTIKIDTLKSRLQLSDPREKAKQGSGQQEYILRNYITGKLLINEEDDPVLKNQCIQKPCTLEIQIATQDQTELQQNSYIQLMSFGQVLQKINMINKWNEESSESFEEIIENCLQFTTKDNIKHAFQVKRIPNAVKDNLMYVLSAQELLYEFAAILDNDPDEIWNILNQSILDNIIECMEQLISFLSTDRQNRQQCMKETYIIELLMKILVHITEKSLYNVEYKAEKHKIKTIFKSTYELIKQMTANNKELKLHVSKWLEVFMNQAILIDEARVQESLIGLLDDNYEAIQKFITEDSINRVIENMIANPHEKYPKILSALCVCKEKAIIKNQNQILTNVYQSQYKSIQFKFKISNQKVFVFSHIKKEQPNWRTLRQFYNDSGEYDDFQSWNYFQSYINLLGDICYNRNRQSQDFVQSHFPITIFLSLLEDPLAQEIKCIEPYLKVLHLGFINNYKFHFQLVSKVIAYEQPKFNDVQSILINADLQKVMHFIQDFIAQFTHFTYDYNYNHTLLRILNIINSSIRLGFWQSINDLIILLHDLLRICSCEQDFKRNTNIDEQEIKEKQSNLKKTKTRMTRMSSENQLIMDCKMLACNIILRILDQENYVRVNQIIKLFNEKMNRTETQESEPNQPDSVQQSTVISHVYGFFTQKYQSLQEAKTPQKKQQELFKDFARSFSKQKDNTELQAYKIQPWIQDIQSLILQRDLFNNLNIIQIFVEMSLFQNPRMVELSLHLLSRLLGQKRDLLNYFSKIVLLSSNGKKDELELAQKAIGIRGKFEFLNNNTLYLKDHTQSVQFNDLIEEIHSLCPKLKMIDIPSYCSEIKIPFNEYEENNKMHQTLFRALDLHECMIEQLNEEENYQQELLDACYKFLTLFIWNHAVNKVEIKWPLQRIYSHIQLNSFSIDFIRELFHNNKELLYNENEVRKAVNCIINTMNSLGNESLYRMKLMDAIRVFQYDHNKVIKVNQSLTLSIFQEKQNKNLIYLLNHLPSDIALVRETRNELNLQQSHIWEQKEFIEMLQQYARSYAKMEQTKYLEIPTELMYQTMFFEIFSILVEEKNQINVEKCRAMHPYASLLAILKHSYLFNCWPLQHFIRSYINRLYYNGELDNICQLILEHDIDMILFQLQEIVKLKETKYIKQVQIKDGVRFQFIFSYIFACMQEILYSINFLFVNEAFLTELENQLNKFEFDYSAKLFKISACLNQVEKLWFKSSHITRTCQVLQNIFKCIFKTFNSEELDKIELILENKDELPLGQEAIQEDDDKRIQRLSTYNYFQKEEEKRQVGLEYTLKRMFHIKRKKTTLEQPDNNKELNIRLNKLTNSFNDNQEFQSFVEQEFNQLCEQLDDLDQISTKVYSQSLISMKEFLRNLIQININNKLNDSERLFFLKMLVRMVTKRNPNINNKEDEQSKLAIDEWDPEFWSDSKDAISEVQNLLDECGAAQLIYKMLQENFDENWSLFNQLLIFANAFLLGGNTKCQQTLLELLKQDQQNSVMTNLQQQILKFSKFIQTNFKMHKAKRSKYLQNPFLSIVYVDNLTTFNDSTETLKRALPSAMESQNSIQNKLISLQVMKRAFRMLQLMCENNNVQMKNFLREQTDKEDVIQLNSINFIEFATRELRIILKILNKSVIPIASQLVEFINEVIQLPCNLNQSTLCKSTFFEDVCLTFENLNKDESVLKLRELHTQEQQDSLFELQGKIVQSILLVLEGNDQRSYEDLQSKLETKFLVNFIKSIFKKMGIQSISEIQFRNDVRFEDEFQQMLNVFIIQQKILHKNPDSKWLKHFQAEFDSTKELIELQEVCLQNLKKIEIFYEDQLQMVFFPAHPVFEFLSDGTRDQIMFLTPRDTQREKLIFLLEQMDNIFREISYNFKLQQWYIPITHQTIYQLIRAALGLSLLINIFMAYAYDVIIKDRQSTLVTDNFEETFLLILSILELIISFTACLFYIFSRAPLEFKKLKQEQWSWKNSFSYVWNLFSNSLVVLQSEDFLSHISYTLIAIIGTFNNSYYFSLHLFYLFGQLSLLQSVFQAISHNAQQLSLVALLGVLFQFVFSIVGFNNYVDDIYQEEPDDPCHSLVSCMITLMTSGVIGSSMAQWDPLKFMYDTVYFVFFALLFTNIISGIMTDTFAQLRDQREQINNDKKNNCFICGIDRQTLEKNQEDFDQHIKTKHFLWNYVFYIYCLINKDSTEYTGLEYWIKEKVDNENTSWFPIQKQDSDDLENLAGTISQVQLKLDSLINALSKEFTEQ